MMDYKEQAKRKHETFAKSTETSELLVGYHDSLVFYTKDGSGAVRMHTYTEAGRTIELVDSFPTVVKPRVVEEDQISAPKKEGIVAKAIRKVKGK